MCCFAAVFPAAAFAQSPVRTAPANANATKAQPAAKKSSFPAPQPTSPPTTAPTSGPASGAPSAVPPRPASPGYVLSPGDTVQLSVFDEEDLEALRTIGSSGEVSLHLIGTVQIGGKTVQAAEKLIKDLYHEMEFLVNPRVSLTLTVFAEHFISVSGAVATPRAVPIPRDGRFDVLAAIAAAGGATEKADLRAVVHRSASGGKSTRCDVTAMQSNPSLARELKSGDSITIPQKVEEWVNVRGEVNRPAPVKVPDSGHIDVLTAITIAGDYSKFAQPKNITVRRNGTIIELDGAAMAKGSARLFELLPGDTLTVGRRRF